MARETELLRDLLFGLGQFARPEAPEPSLIPMLLPFLPSGVVGDSSLIAAFETVVGMYPDLRREVLSACAQRLGELPSDQRGAVLRAHPALLLYAPRKLIDEARRFADSIEDPADRALFLVKLAGRGVGNRAATIKEVRRLVALPTSQESSRLDALVHLAELTAGAERQEAIRALLASPRLVHEPDIAASAAELLPLQERNRLSRAATDAGRALGERRPELRAWALTRLAPGLSVVEQPVAFAEALDAIRELPGTWRQAELLRHALTALRKPETSHAARGSVAPLLRDAAGLSRRWPSELVEYVDTHLRKSVEPLPPIHPLAGRAALLGKSSAAVDREGTTGVALEAVIEAMKIWYIRLLLAAGVSDSGHDNYEMDAGDELGVDEPPAINAGAKLTEFDLILRQQPHIGATYSPRPPRERGRPRETKAVKPEIRPRPKPVSTGFAERRRPGEPLTDAQQITPGAEYYFWLEIGEVAGSIEEKPTPVPVHLLPEKARLVVVLFAPGGGFDLSPQEDLGQLDLMPDGSAAVVTQPAKRYDAQQALLQRRLLFPVRAPAQRGEYRLRCNIYCRGVLVQSRHIDVDVGGINRVSRVSYTLATKLDPAKLQTLAEHRFSVLSNHGPGDNHDFYIYGGNGREAFRDSIAIPPTILGGALEIARAALRRASWGDEGAWAAEKKYRYDGKPDIARLREDLAVLAIAGWRIYDLLANQLAGGKKKVPKLEELVRVPGLVQISPDAGLGMVLPAALIYDYRINPQGGPPAGYLLCPEFEAAYRAKSPLENTECFQGRCPSRGQPTTICPSGFWGFRHGLGMPISDAEEGEEGEAEFNVRLEYSDTPRIVVGVSRAPDLPRTRQHTEELQTLRPDWGKRAWLVEDRLAPLLELMRSKQPHVVYLYCHGSGRPAGATEIPMLYLGENPQYAKPGEWLERSMLRGEIEWNKPRPLVFLNGCHTAVLDERTTLDFVTGFVQNANACGVVGTEVTVFEPLAGAFAQRFMERFLGERSLGGAPVGQAIRDARLDLLREGNPLGLVYTPFVLSGTKLVQTTE